MRRCELLRNSIAVWTFTFLSHLLISQSGNVRFGTDQAVSLSPDTIQYIAFKLRKDIVELGDLVVEFRRNKIAWQYFAGAKGLTPLMQGPAFLIGQALYSDMIGPRAGAGFRYYPSNEQEYVELSFSSEYLQHSGRFNACTHCGEIINMDFRRLDLIFKINFGIVNKLRSRYLAEINFAGGVRIIYLNSSVNWTNPSGIMNYAEVVGSTFAFGPPGVINGTFITPVSNLNFVLLGVRKFKQHR